MIKFLEDDAIVGDEQFAYTFEVVDEKRQNANSRPWSPLDAFNDRGFVSRYDGWNVFPYGENNDLPMRIRNTVYENSKIPGILNKNTGMNWGKGPKLYTEEIVDGELVRKYVKDEEIENWLDSWDWETYILKVSIDYSFGESFFTKIPMKRGLLVGEPAKVHSLIHVLPNKPMVVGKLKTPTHVLLEKQDNPGEYEVFPLFDKKNPKNYGVSVLYSNLPSYCSEFFTIPSIFGSLPWIATDSKIPKFFDALITNSIHPKFHITSPQAYWDAKRKEIQEQCEASEKPYKESMLKSFKRNLLKQIENVLKGYENAGKFWHSEEVLETVLGTTVTLGWKITPIEQKVQEVVDSYTTISKVATQSASAGIGVSTSIGNVTDTGKNNGGSEQYYALNNHLQTSVDIPEMVIMEAMNIALKINWPNKKIKMGFYHEMPKQQQDLNSQNRGLIANK